MIMDRRTMRARRRAARAARVSIAAAFDRLARVESYIVASAETLVYLAGRRV